MKNIKSRLAAIIVFISFNSLSQNYNWAWLTQIPKGSNSSLIYSKTGQLYTVGAITTSNTVIGTTTYNPINQDGIIIKYDTNGNILWSSSIEGNGSEWCNGIAADSIGNLYVVGWTTSSVVTIGSSTLTSGFGWPDNAMFISKFDGNGNLIYFKTISHGDYVNTLGLKISIGSNNIVISNLIPSNNLIAFVSNSISAQNDDTYIASFDLNANLNWVNFYSTPGYECILDLSVQKNGDIYFSGTTSSQAFVIGGYTLSGISFSVYAGFIGRLNTSGNLKWVKTFPNANVPNIKIAALTTNSIYLGIGFTSAALNIGSNIYSTQNSDCIVAQLDSMGNYKWSKLISGNQAEGIGGLSVNQNGYVYIAGISASSILSTANYSIANSNTVNNLFFAAFDLQGNDIGLLMSSRPNSTNLYGIAPYSISIDANNNGYMLGTNNSDLVCGTYSISSNTQNTTFMAKIKLLNGVGIQESTFIKDELAIYPNPAQSEISLSSEKTIFQKINILDITGKLVLEQMVNEKISTVNIAHLPQGVYIVQALTANKQYLVAKLVKVNE